MSLHGNIVVRDIIPVETECASYRVLPGHLYVFHGIICVLKYRLVTATILQNVLNIWPNICNRNLQMLQHDWLSYCFAISHKCTVTGGCLQNCDVYLFLN